ncbi:MAG TPA: transporter, partial [Rhizobiaceae bacterium]|nr:transporter [Rhizobiaceae bacterium]
MVVSAGLAIFAASSALAQDNDAELAKQLSNPVASLISVPFQGNYDTGIGPLEDGSRFYVNVQPVIPISL